MRVLAASPQGAEAPTESISKLAEIICESGELPASAKVVSTILNLKPEDEFSAQELASIILKDYGLTHRILRMANSCYFNPTGQEVTTVSRAIVLLGVEFIREMAVAAVLFDTLIKKVPPEGRRGLLSSLAQSYFCAFLAKALAPKISNNPEGVFISALFHRIGRILLTIYSPGTLLRWEELEKKRPEIVKKRLYHLMEKVMLCWALPQGLVDTLEGSPKAQEKGSLASWVSKLDQSVQTFFHTGEGKSLQQLFEKQGLSRDDLKRHLTWAREALKEFCPSLAQVWEKQKEIKAPTRPVETQEDFFQKAVREITAALASPESNYQEILLMIIETLARAMSCQEVLLCIPRLDLKALVIKYGLGNNIKHLQGREIPYGPFFKTLFSKGVEWSGPVENLPKPNPLLSWARGQDLLVSPLSIKGRGVGAFLALREAPFTMGEKKMAETLRHLAILALKQGR